MVNVFAILVFVNANAFVGYSSVYLLKLPGQIKRRTPS